MSIIVEDGTGKTDSETYITIVEYQSYLTNYGYAADTGTDAEIEAAMRRGMIKIESFAYKGEHTNSDQALSYPRVNVSYRGKYIDSDEIPTGLKNATAEATRLERATSGILSQSVTKNIKKKKIDVLETEYFSPSGSTTKYTQIENFLKGLIYSSSLVEFERG